MEGCGVCLSVSIYVFLYCSSSQAGEFLADGFGAVVWGLFGDQDYKRDCLRLPNVNSNTPCDHCPANVSDVPWFDFRDGAAWVSRIYTQLQWKAAGLDKKCFLFGIVGVTNLSIYPDWMHDKNLGSDKVTYAIASYVVL